MKLSLLKTTTPIAGLALITLQACSSASPALPTSLQGDGETPRDSTDRDVQSFRDNVGSSVTIDTASWENFERDVVVSFSGAALNTQILRNCYPSGTFEDLDGDGMSDHSTHGALILQTSERGTEAGIRYSRGESLCRLSWNSLTLKLKGPIGETLWRFDAQ